MNSSVATLSTENLVNELVGETTPSTSGYGSSMKVSIIFVCLCLTPFLTLCAILQILEQRVALVMVGVFSMLRRQCHCC